MIAGRQTRAPNTNTCTKFSNISVTLMSCSAVVLSQRLLCKHLTSQNNSCVCTITGPLRIMNIITTQTCLELVTNLFVARAA